MSIDLVQSSAPNVISVPFLWRRTLKTPSPRVLIRGSFCIARQAIRLPGRATVCIIRGEVVVTMTLLGETRLPSCRLYRALQTRR